MTGEDDDIVIRDFEPKDLDRVKTIFRNGMMSLAPTMTKLLTRHRLVSPDLAHPLVLSLPLLAMAPRQPHNNYRVSSLLAYTGAALVGTLGWFAYHAYLAAKLFEEYIEYSIASDISNIPDVYQSKKGSFLVAATKDSDLVVGMVGLEFKEQELKDDGTTRSVYEIRRFSVDAQVQGKGIGQRLLHALENRLPMQSRLFAETSNVQPSAQRMYARNGFALTRTSSLDGWPLPFQLWSYEKEVLQK